MINLIKRLFNSARIENSAQTCKTVRIFLAQQVKTDRNTYKVYIEGKDTGILLTYKDVAKLLNKEQLRDMTYNDETMFDVPDEWIKNNAIYIVGGNLNGRHINGTNFNTKEQCRKSLTTE